MSGTTTATDVTSAAHQLLAGLVDEPLSRMSPSVYETARLVAIAPWLTGHAERIGFLLGSQNDDGTWGGRDGYAIVPTLSAVEALLRTGHVEAAGRGLRGLGEWGRLPDMPGIELIVPSLIDAITGRTRTLWSGPVHEKMLHCLEVLPVPPGLRPVGPGTIGASPAATAAWLNTSPPEPERALAHLEYVVRKHSGPVPCGYPVAAFERGWVITSLAFAGIDVAVPQELIADLRNCIGDKGSPGGPGLPPDADTTSVALSAIGATDVSSLRHFDAGTHYCTWPGETNPSTSVNAHVLDAVGHDQRVVDWLCARQHDDGSWTDRWHASPCYATTTVALALHRNGNAPAAVRRAVEWALRAQRADGSWGRWHGTAEETAYAMQLLLLTGHREAALRGYPHLLGDHEHPPLWHDKDLYTPYAVVEAAVLAAIHLAQQEMR